MLLYIIHGLNSLVSMHPTSTNPWEWKGGKQKTEKKNEGKIVYKFT